MPPPEKPTEDLSAAIGSVADEAAKLVESLRAAQHADAPAPDDRGSHDHGHSHADPHQSHHAHDSDAGDDGSRYEHTHHGDTHHDGYRSADDGADEWRAYARDHREPPLTCVRLCPVCRGADILRTLSPELLERLADLAGAAALAFQDAAHAAADMSAEAMMAGDDPVDPDRRRPATPEAARAARAERRARARRAARRTTQSQQIRIVNEDEEQT